MKCTTFILFYVLVLTKSNNGISLKNDLIRPILFNFEGLKIEPSLWRTKSWGGDDKGGNKYESPHKLIGWGDKGKYFDDWKNHGDKWSKRGGKSHHLDKHLGFRGWRDYKKRYKGKKHKHWQSGGKSDRWKSWGNKWNYKKDKGSGYIKSFSWHRESGKSTHDGDKGKHWKDWTNKGTKDYWEGNAKKKHGYKKHKHNDSYGWWNHSGHHDRWRNWAKHNRGGEHWSSKKYAKSSKWRH